MPLEKDEDGNLKVEVGGLWGWITIGFAVIGFGTVIYWGFLLFN